MSLAHLRFRLLSGCLFLSFCLSGTFLIGQNIPFQPLSTEANVGCNPCKDTVRVLFFKRVYDVSLLLPEWKPVVGPHHVAVLEGEVVAPKGKYNSCHVSPVDYSAYHNSHDFGFDVLPDQGYENVLARRVYTGLEQEVVDPVKDKKAKAREHAPDTVLQETMHVEWESGLAAGNKGNPCRNANCAGESGGFFSGGHQRRQPLWQWPTVGDWVHLEGQWIWDRGHPPARTEIHPIRFCATRRHLPDRIAGNADSVFATRIDIFGSGDGGALFNNRAGQPDFVQAVRMSDKDYAVQVRPILPRPSAQSRLRFRVEKRPGDTHPLPLDIAVLDEGGNAALNIRLPWQGQPDSLICARSVLMWWDEGDGVAADYKIHSYRVDFEELQLRKRKEFSSRGEYRIFFEVGGQWFFLNEFDDVEDILHQGMGNTFRKRLPMGQTLTVHVPEDQQFRVHVGGWEADGISRSFGHLLDPNAPCTKATKKALHKHLFAATPFALHGCLDDLMGEIHSYYTPGKLGSGQAFTDSSDGPTIKMDQCPCVRGTQKGIFDVKYEIRRLGE